MGNGYRRLLDEERGLERLARGLIDYEATYPHERPSKPDLARSLFPMVDVFNWNFSNDDSPFREALVRFFQKTYTFLEEWPGVDAVSYTSEWPTPQQEHLTMYFLEVKGKRPSKGSDGYLRKRRQFSLKKNQLDWLEENVETLQRSLPITRANGRELSIVKAEPMYAFLFHDNADADRWECTFMPPSLIRYECGNPEKSRLRHFKTKKPSHSAQYVINIGYVRKLIEEGLLVDRTTDEHRGMGLSIVAPPDMVLPATRLEAKLREGLPLEEASVAATLEGMEDLDQDWAISEYCATENPTPAEMRVLGRYAARTVPF